MAFKINKEQRKDKYMETIKPKMEYSAPFDIEYDILKTLVNGIDIIHSMSEEDKMDFLIALGAIKSAIDNKKIEPTVIEVEKEVVKPIIQEVVVKEPVIKTIETQVIVKEPVIKEVEKQIIQVIEKPVEKIKYVDKIIEKPVEKIKYVDKIVYRDRETIKYVDCATKEEKKQTVIIHKNTDNKCGCPDIIIKPKKKQQANIGRFSNRSACLKEGIVINYGIPLPSWAHGERYNDFKKMSEEDFKACVDWMFNISKKYGCNAYRIYKLP